jgi:hypothetical protein
MKVINAAVKAADKARAAADKEIEKMTKAAGKLNAKVEALSA